MNKELIRRWNEVVKPEDTVYHLGDFAFSRPDKTNEIASQLNGTKFIVLGNHDKDAPINFKRVEQCHELYDFNQKVVLCHYGLRVWNRSHHGSLLLYGHSHGSLPGNSQSLDVGVDCWDYYPVNLPTIMKRMATLPSYKSEDHHK